MLRRNVLIFHAGALGDLVLSWPLALAAGRLFPQSRIFYVTQGQKGALCERVLRVEWADIEVGWHRLFADGELPVPAGKTLAAAHTVFSFLAEQEGAWTANVRAINPYAKLINLRTRPSPDYARHASEFLLDQLAGDTAIHKAVDQILRSIAARGVGLRCGQADGPVVVHPGSGSRQKCWPLERFAVLAERLNAKGRAARFVLGEVERERFSSDDLARLGRIAPVIWPSNYIELLDELAQASMFVGNDSGPSHLAGIIGLPTVAIFAPTDPTVWRPLGPRVRIVQKQQLDQIEVDDVLQAMHAP